MTNVATRALKLTLIPYYENKEMNKNKQKIWEWKYLFVFCISSKIENQIYTSTVPILDIAK